ncbi:hypothetical protein ACFLQ2_00365 [archaeon]
MARKSEAEELEEAQAKEKEEARANKLEDAKLKRQVDILKNKLAVEIRKGERVDSYVAKLLAHMHLKDVIDNDLPLDFELQPVADKLVHEFNDKTPESVTHYLAAAIHRDGRDEDRAGMDRRTAKILAHVHVNKRVERGLPLTFDLGLAVRTVVEEFTRSIHDPNMAMDPMMSMAVGIIKGNGVFNEEAQALPLTLTREQLKDKMDPPKLASHMMENRKKIFPELKEKGKTKKAPKELERGMKTSYPCPDCGTFMNATHDDDWVRCKPCEKSHHRDQIKEHFVP